MRKEFKYGIGGLIFGFVFCLCLFLLVISVSAAEPVEIQESHDQGTAQGEQAETGQTFGQQEQDQEPVQEDQIDLAAMIPADQLEMLDSWAQEITASEEEPRIEPFASGVIVGELADLLQDNVIENDGYTEDSWQRYEEAVSAGWTAITNFMTYTNDEVQAVIDELKTSIVGLEYPEGKLPESGGGSSVDNGIIAGLLAVLVFSSGLKVAT